MCWHVINWQCNAFILTISFGKHANIEDKNTYMYIHITDFLNQYAWKMTVIEISVFSFSQ